MIDPGGWSSFKLSKAWKEMTDEFSFLVGRPTQIARGQYEPRPGLTPQQNVYLDLTGWDDRTLLGNRTERGRNYLLKELTEVRPFMEEFRRSFAAQFIGEVNPVAGLMIQSDKVRNVAEHATAEASTDPVIMVPEGFRALRSLWRAARLNRFNTGAMSNLAVTGRFYRSVKVRPLSPNPTTGESGQLVTRPYLHTPNYQMTEWLHDYVYNYRLTNTEAGRKKTMLPAQIKERGVVPPMAGEMRDLPTRWNSERYIEWLYEPMDNDHKALLAAHAERLYGPLADFFYEIAPSRGSSYIRPDVRQDALTRTGVPIRASEKEGAPQVTTTYGPGPTRPTESRYILKSIYERAVETYHQNTSLSQAEVQRLQRAASTKYYEQRYGPRILRKYSSIRRSQPDPKVTDILDPEDDDYEILSQLVTELSRDTSPGTEDITKYGHLASRTDLSDLDSIVYEQTPRGPVGSRMLQKIHDGDIQDLPWSVKPSYRHRIGSTYIPDTNPRSGPPATRFRDLMNQWRTSEGAFNPNRIVHNPVDQIFYEMLQSGAIDGSQQSFVNHARRNPNIRDVFYNPYNGNVHELVDYLKRHDPQMLRYAEGLKLSRTRRPYERRFSAPYPVVRFPGDVVVGPSMRYVPPSTADEGDVLQPPRLETNLHSSRTWLEITRVSNSMFGHTQIKPVSQTLNAMLRDEFVAQGYDDPEHTVYDPYTNTIYPARALDEAARRAVAPFRKALDNVADDSRRAELEGLVVGAEAFLRDTLSEAMAGSSEATYGTQILMKRLHRQDNSTSVDLKSSEYSIPQILSRRMEDSLELLKSVDEFSSVRAMGDPYYHLNETMQYEERGGLSEEFLYRLSRGVAEGERAVPLYDPDIVSNYVKGGGVVNYTSPVVTEAPSNSWGFHVPAWTPATGDMIARSIQDIRNPYLESQGALNPTDVAISNEGRLERNVFTGPMQIADHSLTSLIQIATEKADAAIHGSNMQVVQDTPIADHARGLLFDQINLTDEDLHGTLRELIPTSLAQHDVLLGGDLSANDMQALQDGPLAPKDTYVVNLTLPENAMTWNASTLTSAYSGHVQELMLRHPQIMTANLMHTYDTLIEALRSPTNDSTIGTINSALEHLMDNIIPNYEMVVGQDPIARSQLVHIGNELKDLSQDDFMQRIPEFMKDIKGLLAHMGGTFSSRHQGVMMQTALRAVRVPDNAQVTVMNYIRGYSNNVLSAGESIVTQQYEAIQHLLNRSRAGLPITSGWGYDVPQADIDDLANLVGTIDRPIRMDPYAMTLASEITGDIQWMHQLLNDLKGQKTVLNPNQFEYLQEMATKLDSNLGKLYHSVNEHYMESLYNLASDPDTSLESFQTHFEVRGTAMGTIAENPAALGIAKMLDTHEVDQVRQTALRARAAGTITKTQHDGLMKMAELTDLSKRSDILESLFDVFSATKPNLPHHVADAVLTASFSAHGEPMQRAVELIKEDGDFAKYFVQKAINYAGGDPVQGTILMSEKLNVEVLPYAKVLYSEYGDIGRNLIDIIALTLREQLR